ncbi:MAG: DedA family protein [Hyphomicrobiaceae bacterium]
MTELFDELVAFTRENEAYVGPVVFAIAFAESLVLVSLFVPSTVLFLAIGAAHGASGGAFVPVWIAGTLGAFLGDVVSFIVGRYLRQDVAKVWPFASYPRLLARSRLAFARYGAATIVTGKFLGNLRPFLPVAAGALRMRWTTFLVASLISCITWAGVFLAPGYGLMLAFQ